MVKNNILTPVLAGVLGLSIVGSGVGYYFVNKDADSAEAKNGKSAKISQVADNINETLDTAEKAIKGELDYAYDATVKVTMGAGFTELTGGTSYQPVTVSTSTKQKGKNTGADISFSYGDSTIATLNTVYSRDDETVYAKVPELSDSYLKMTKESLSEMLESEVGMDLNAVGETTPDIEFDYEAFEKSLKDYEEVAKANLPEGTDDGTYSGSIEDIEYSYTKTKYVITATDAQNVINAVLDKAKTDENLKKLYDSSVESIYGDMTSTDIDSEYSYTPPTYEETIDSLKEELSIDAEDENESVTFTSYKDKDGNFMGFNLVPNDDEGSMNYVVVSTDDAEGIDMKFDGGDGTEMTMYGAVKSDEEDVLNGSYKMEVKEDGQNTAEIDFEVKDVKAVDDTFTGTIRMDMNFNDSSEAVSGWAEITSNSAGDNIDLDFEIGLNGKSFMKFEIDGAKTEASDVTVPTGTIYDAADETQLDEYLGTCDIEGFEANLKNALGEELYNEIMGAAESGLTEDDYYYDDDYYLDDDYSFDDDMYLQFDDEDYDDYSFDFDDYDFDDAIISYDENVTA